LSVQRCGMRQELSLQSSTITYYSGWSSVFLF